MNFKFSYIFAMIFLSCDAMTSLDPPMLPYTVIYPDSISDWSIGGQYTITWNENSSAFSVEIDVGCGSKDENDSDYGWPSSIESSTDNDGDYEWTIPSGQEISDSCYIRICDFGNSNVCGYSEYFSIKAPDISVSDPMAGLSLSKGSSFNINWTAGNLSRVKIYLYRLSDYGSDINIKTIDSNEDNDGTYLWDIDEDISVDDNYFIKICDRYNNNICGDSDKFSIIDNPFISPSSGVTWYEESTYTIEWTKEYIQSSLLTIDLYKSGTFYSTISNPASVYNDGEYSWYVVGPMSDGWSSNDYTIKICDYYNSTTCYESADFTISPVSVAPITVTSPSSGDTWYEESTYTIEWTENLSILYVSIKLYKSDAFWQNIATYTNNDGDFSWTPPTSLSESSYYTIKICDYNDNTSCGESSDFTISPALITITSPSSGEIIEKSSSHTISWSETISSSSTFRIDLYLNGNYVETLSSSTYTSAGVGSYSWSVDSSLSNSSLYTIKICNYYDLSTCDESDSFTVSD